MALPSDPVGRALAQMVARDRYERWLNDEVQRILEAGLRDVAATMVTQFGTLTPNQLQRRAVLFKQIGRQLAATYGEGRDFMMAQMKSFAGIESRATIGHFRNLVADSPDAELTLANLTKAEVRAIAQFPIAGLGIGDWFEKQASDMNVAIRAQIQLGLMNGEGPEKIVSTRLLPTRETLEAPGVLPRTRRGTLALVRTTTTTIQTQATYATLESIGPELCPAYRYVAVRDARTTPICRALDGKVFRFDDPKAKRPPQHVNCRSTIVAVPDYAKLGIPAPNTVKGGLTMGSYAGWLQSQSAAAQDDILGRPAAALFRSGKASLSDLVNADGRKMSNKALAEVYGVAA